MININDNDRNSTTSDITHHSYAHVDGYRRPGGGGGGGGSGSGDGDGRRNTIFNDDGELYDSGTRNTTDSSCTVAGCCTLLADAPCCVCDNNNPKDRLKGIPLLISTGFLIILSALNYSLLLTLCKKVLLFSPLVTQFLLPMVSACMALPVCVFLLVYHKCRKCNIQDTKRRGCSNYTSLSWKSLAFIFSIVSCLQYYSMFAFSRYAPYLPEHLRSVAMVSGAIIAVTYGIVYKQWDENKRERFYSKKNRFCYYAGLLCLAAMLTFLAVDVVSDYDKLKDDEPLETYYPCFATLESRGSESLPYGFNLTDLNRFNVVISDNILPLKAKNFKSGNGSYQTFATLFTVMVIFYSILQASSHAFVETKLKSVAELSPIILTLWTTVFQLFWVIITVPFFNLEKTFSYGSNYVREGMTCLTSSHRGSDIFKNLPMVDINHVENGMYTETAHQFTPCDDWRSRVDCHDIMTYVFLISLLVLLETWLKYKILRSVDSEYLWFVLTTSFTVKDVLFSLTGFSGIYARSYDAYDLFIVLGMIFIVIIYYNLSYEKIRQQNINTQFRQDDGVSGQIFVVNPDDEEEESKSNTYTGVKRSDSSRLASSNDTMVELTQFQSL